MKRLRALDLFAGLGGWSGPFRDRHHHVTTLDFEARFKCDFVLDILKVKSLSELERGRGRFDVVLASPPCERFSVMTISKNWRATRDGPVPITDGAKLAMRVMRKTFALIDAYKPTYYVVENPRGMMRKLSPREPTDTTWYCQWGMPYAKPTDVWTNVRGRWPSCFSQNRDHDAQPATYFAKKAVGALDKGTQGRFMGRAFIQNAHGFSTVATSGKRNTSRPRRIYDADGYYTRPSGIRRKATMFELSTSGSARNDWKGSAMRALIPYPMAAAFAYACETDSAIMNLRALRAVSPVFAKLIDDHKAA